MKQFVNAILMIVLGVFLLPMVALAAGTESFRYTDSESGMSFTVPANWVESAMFEEREYIDAKFTSNIEEGVCIFFSCEDMLGDRFLEEAGISSLEKKLISRSELDNSLFTKADVAAMYGESSNAVSMVSYGNKEYYALETEQTATVYGVSVTVPLTVHVRCENGYMYMFQFNGTKSNPYFNDLEELLNSAEYPLVEDESLAHRRIIGVVFLGIVVCVVVFLGLQRRRTAAATVVHNSATTDKGKGTFEDAPMGTGLVVTEQNEAAVNRRKPAAFCYNCGCKIEIGSRFCHNCGTRISDKERE